MVKVYQEFVDCVFTIIKNQNSITDYKKQKYQIIPLIAGLSVGQIIVIEIVHRGSLSSFWHWFIREPKIFVINTLLAAAICLISMAVFGSCRHGIIVSTVSLIFLGIVSTVKKQFLGDPLLPWDYNRLDQVYALIPNVVRDMILALTLLILLIFTFTLIIRALVPQRSLSKRLRILMLAGVMFFAYGVSSFSFNLAPGFINSGQAVLNQTGERILIEPDSQFDKALNHGQENMSDEQLGIKLGHWLNNKDYGFLLGFWLQLEQMKINPPQGYSKETIAKIIDNIKTYSAPSKVPDSRAETKPNVVVILSEAFWDPTKMKAVSFSEDPIPNFRSLSASHTSGSLISPVFGGSTANAEFEFLTGMNIKYLPDGVIVFDHFIEREVPSIASILAENGYNTAAIHPYKDWFYKRNKVYPLLGFKDFITMNEFTQPEVKGDYISDLEVSKKIIERFENSSRPRFIYTVTMQNHAPYTSGRYKQNHIQILGGVPDNGEDILETYTQGLMDADYALKYLVDYFSKIDEPTIICFFGDHLPYLGKDYLVYQQAGYIQHDDKLWTASDQLKMKEVPFMIWTNYSVPVKQNLSMSTCFLGAYLMELADIELTPFLKTVRKTCNSLPVLNKTVTMDNGYIIQDKQLDPANLEHNYAIMQYDILFGEGYYRQPSKTD